MRWLTYLVLVAAPPNMLHPSDIKSDETVRLFPTYARRACDGTAWEVTVHAWVCEPEENSTKRAALLGLLRRLLGLDRKQIETDLFKDRARAFLVDNERGKTVVVRLMDHRLELPKTASNGHAVLQTRLVGPAVSKPTWQPIRVILDSGDARAFDGRCLFIPPTGLSVVSDIDDTIKVTGVHSEESVMRNTFLREFEVVEGMADLFNRWSRQGAAFHYVSASPWQLCHKLDGFIGTSGLPRGSMHLRSLRFKDKTFFEFLGSSKAAKLTTLRQLMIAFPQRRFILVGDSTQHDPEVYGQIARTYRTQVQRILIRLVDPAHDDPLRFATAFADLPETLWQVFADPRDVQ